MVSSVFSFSLAPSLGATVGEISGEIVNMTFAESATFARQAHLNDDQHIDDLDLPCNGIRS